MSNQTACTVATFDIEYVFWRLLFSTLTSMSQDYGCYKGGGGVATISGGNFVVFLVPQMKRTQDLLLIP